MQIHVLHVVGVRPQVLLLHVAHTTRTSVFAPRLPVDFSALDSQTSALIRSVLPLRLHVPENLLPLPPLSLLPLSIC